MKEKSILEKLFYGEIFPSEAIVPRDPEYRPTCHKISEERSYLALHMEPEDRQHLDALMELTTVRDSFTQFSSFVYGLRLGLFLTLELLADEGPHTP